MVAIGRGAVLAQARAVQKIAGEQQRAQLVRRARRDGADLLVIQRDIMRGDIGEITRIELELAGDDVLAHRPLIAAIHIGAEIARMVIEGDFAAILPPALVIERGQDDGRAELAFIEKPARGFIESVQAHFRAFENGLGHARIVIIRPLGFWRGVQMAVRRRRGVVETGDIGGRHQLDGRGREIAREPGMDGGAFGRLPHHVDARAELVFMPESAELVIAQTVIQGQRGHQLPFILRIQAIRPGMLGAIVGDGKRRGRCLADGGRITGRVGVGIAGAAGRGGQHQRRRTAQDVIRLQQHAETRRVIVARMPGRFRLHAIRHIALVGRLGIAVVEKPAQIRARRVIQA